MSRANFWRNCGPGLVVAATGLGAGDIVTAAVAGAQYGPALLWAIVLGGLLKFVLNEGIGRWQLLSGTTLLEGWIRYLPRFISIYFIVYLLLWSVMVGAAMMAATGLAAHALLPQLEVTQWGILHALAALAIVYSGAWRMLENLMKGFIALMFVAILLCAGMVLVETPGVLSGLLRPSVPEGSITTIFSVMGGVGGSVTLLSYGYWIREAGWRGPEKLATMRLDLAVAYSLTALFGVAVMLLAAGLKPAVVSGNGMALALAEQLVPVGGQPALWIFLFGFWGATFSSMIGVWHGVPYLFANFVHHYRAQAAGESQPVSVLDEADSLSHSRAYRGYLVCLCFIPMLLLVQDRPVWIVVLYAITGAFFMPLLAALLLLMNRMRPILGNHVSGWTTQLLLIATLAIFGYLLVMELLF